MRTLFTLLATATGVVGGLILLAFQSTGSSEWSIDGQNIFETLSHGLGMFVIALTVLGLIVALDVARIKEIEEIETEVA